MRIFTNSKIIGGALAAVGCMFEVGIASAQSTGPSSSQSAYVLPTVPVAATTSLLTVGDSLAGYRMVGIPDGLGAFDNGDGTFTLLMNHELGNTSGATRAHGAKGAFVSKWTIDKSTLAVMVRG